jgi:hypothetical protein
MRLFCYIIRRRSYYLAEMGQSVATGRTVRDSNPGWGNAIFFFPKPSKPDLGSPSLLFSENRDTFPWVKQSRREDH